MAEVAKSEQYKAWFDYVQVGDYVTCVRLPPVTKARVGPKLTLGKQYEVRAIAGDRQARRWIYLRILPDRGTALCSYPGYRFDFRPPTGRDRFVPPVQKEWRALLVVNQTPDGLQPAKPKTPPLDPSQWTGQRKLTR